MRPKPKTSPREPKPDVIYAASLCVTPIIPSKSLQLTPCTQCIPDLFFMFSNISQYAVKYNYDHYPIHSISSVVIGLRTLRDFQMLSTGEHGYTNAIQPSVFFLNIEHDPKAVDLQCHTCSKIENHNLQHKYVQSLMSSNYPTLSHTPTFCSTTVWPIFVHPQSSLTAVTISPCHSSQLCKALGHSRHEASFTRQVCHLTFSLPFHFHGFHIFPSHFFIQQSFFAWFQIIDTSHELWRCCNIRMVVSSYRRVVVTTGLWSRYDAGEFWCVKLIGAMDLGQRDAIQKSFANICRNV